MFPPPESSSSLYLTDSGSDGINSSSNVNSDPEDVLPSPDIIDKNENLGSGLEHNCDAELTNTGQQILSIAIPAFLGLTIDPLMTIVDTAFIGRTSINADALAGVGSAAGLLTFSFYLFNFLTTVTTPLVSQRRAAGDQIGAINIGGQALSLALLLGVCLLVVLMTLSQPLLQIMGAGNIGIDAAEYATSFLQIRALAAPAVFLSSASTGILRGYLDTKTTFYILLGTNIINISLDVLLIGFANLGPKGAAIATTTAEWLAAASFLGVLVGILPSANGKLGSNQEHSQGHSLQEPLLPQNQDNDLVEDGSFTKIKPSFNIISWASIKPLIVASSSSLSRSFVLQLVIAGATAMAARGGNDVTEAAAASIAAHQIALQLWLLCSFVCDALAAASQALVSDAIGRSDPNGTKNVCRVVFLYSLGLGSILSVFLVLGNLGGFLVSFFTNDSATQDALKRILFIVTLSQPLNAYVFAADGVIQGASEFTYEAKSMLLSASIALLSFLSFEFFFGFEDRLSHIWYGLVILQLMRGLTATWKIIDPDGPIDLLSHRTLSS